LLNLKFEGAVCNSLIVWVVIVPNKRFRPLQKKRKKKKEKEKKIRRRKKKERKNKRKKKKRRRRKKKDKTRRRKKGLNLLFSLCCASCSFQ